MRYRAGWLMKDRILALTHFEPLITAEDFSNIAKDTQLALQEVTQTFHILIDNRNMAETTILSLDTMLQAMPIIRHPQLRWMVVVLPKTIRANASSVEVQRNGSIQLKYVESLDAALQHLAEADSRINASSIELSFFLPE